jgi:hypothetical protein
LGYCNTLANVSISAKRTSFFCPIAGKDKMPAVKF